MSVTAGPRRDAGFSLIELMVTSLLVGLVTIAVASVLIGTTTAERSVRTVATATNSGGLVARTITDRLTNAATPILPPAITGDQVVAARVASKGSTAVWSCMAWFYSASDRTVRQTTYTPPLGTVTTASQRSWTLLADGVRPLSGSTGIFSAIGTVGVGLAFTVDAGSSPPVKFQTSITSQTRVAGSAPCF